MPRLTMTLSAVVVSLTLVGTPAAAQSTLNGDWVGLFHEDQPERGPGPALGDYLGRVGQSVFSRAEPIGCHTDDVRAKPTTADWSLEPWAA